MTPMRCVEIKGIKSHGGLAAMREESVVPKVTALIASVLLTNLICFSESAE